MSEGPVEAEGTRAEPMRVPAAGPDNGTGLMPALSAAKSYVVVNADLLPAVTILSLVSLLGLPLGWLWSRLAPPQQSMLTARGELSPLLVEGYHEFDSLAIFLLLSLAFGALTGVAVWMVRGRRGPVVLVAAVIGSMIAAWLGIRMGGSLAQSLYPLPPAPKVGDLITLAPKVSTLWAVVAEPLGTALAYGLATSWNGLDDLGRRLS